MFDTFRLKYRFLGKEDGDKMNEWLCHHLISHYAPSRCADSNLSSCLTHPYEAFSPLDNISTRFNASRPLVFLNLFL